MMRAYKFQLRPTVGQAQALGEMLRDHCSLYNGALEDRKGAYKHRSAQLKEIRAFRCAAASGVLSEEENG